MGNQKYMYQARTLFCHVIHNYREFRRLFGTWLEQTMYKSSKKKEWNEFHRDIGFIKKNSSCIDTNREK